MSDARTMTLATLPAILQERVEYKPHQYPVFFDYFLKQNQAHWLPTEVQMESDVNDFRFKLTPGERNLVTQVLRFFTQGDLEVNNNYNQILIPAFPKPEIKMMLSAFAAMESIHVWAYSYLNDTLGLPESDYRAFMNYESMRAKCEFLQRVLFEGASTPARIARDLAVFGGFMEGISLFGSFAILMNFPRLGKLKGVGQIVTWSVRDENLHSEGVCALFRQLCAEVPGLRESLKVQLYQDCAQMLELEDAFIDTCFELGDVSGLSAAQVKLYIRHIADRRLTQLGLRAIYNTPNPLPWLDALLSAREHANFFETRATEYSKGMVIQDW